MTFLKDGYRTVLAGRRKDALEEGKRDRRPAEAEARLALVRDRLVTHLRPAVAPAPAPAAGAPPRAEPTWLGPPAPARPVRVISLAPSLTDTVIALGLSDNLLTCLCRAWDPDLGRTGCALRDAMLAELKNSHPANFITRTLILDSGCSGWTPENGHDHIVDEFVMRLPLRVWFSRDELLAEVWGYHDGSGGRTVDSHVRALRRKLGNDVVRTVHGVGYAAGGADNRGTPS